MKIGNAQLFRACKWECILKNGPKTRDFRAGQWMCTIWYTPDVVISCTDKGNCVFMYKLGLLVNPDSPQGRGSALQQHRKRFIFNPPPRKNIKPHIPKIIFHMWRFSLCLPFSRANAEPSEAITAGGGGLRKMPRTNCQSRRQHPGCLTSAHSCFLSCRTILASTVFTIRCK